MATQGGLLKRKRGSTILDSAQQAAQTPSLTAGGSETEGRASAFITHLSTGWQELSSDSSENCGCFWRMSWLSFQYEKIYKTDL